jgi:hypothetical protein
MNTVHKIDGSTTSVAVVNAQGSGQVIVLQQLANNIDILTKQLAAQSAIVTQITALGITMPAPVEVSGPLPH